MPTIEDFINCEPLIPEQHVFLIVEAPQDSNSEIQAEISNAVQSVINILRHEAQSTGKCQVKLSVLTFGADCVWMDGPDPVPLSDFTWKGCVPSPCCNFGLALEVLSTRLNALTPKEPSIHVLGVPMFWFLMHSFPSDSYKEALGRLGKHYLYQRGHHFALRFKQSDISAFLEEIVDDVEAIVDASDEKLIASICRGRSNEICHLDLFDPDEFCPHQSFSECEETHGFRIPAHEIYNTLASSENIKEIVDICTDNLTDSQMAAWLFRKLDLLADATSIKRIDLSKDLSVCYRKSTSPTGKFQAWIINSRIVIFSEDSVWCAFQHVLFLEGELMMRDIVWNENEKSVSFTLFYIVHNESKKRKVILSDSNALSDHSVHSIKRQSGTESSRLETLMAYSEICAILNLLETSYADRVPEEVKTFFYEERLEDYEPQIDPSKPLNEQQLQRETFVLLALLNVNYWCDSEEERESYLKEMALNDNKEFDKNDTSWDLSRIFNQNKRNTDVSIHQESTKKFTIDFINGTSQELISGQSLSVAKGQIMPCASLGEYAQEIITLTCTHGKCRVENHSSLVLDALITIRPGDSFYLQQYDEIFTDENITISPLVVKNISNDTTCWKPVCTFGVTCHDGSSHTWKMEMDWYQEIKRCQLGPCSPDSAGDVVFEISHSDDGYQVTNVSPYIFSVIKEFQNEDYLDIEAGCKIAKHNDNRKDLCIYMDIAVCKAMPNLTTSTVPVQNSIVWDDGEW